MSYEAILEIPNVVVVPGPAGQSFLPVDDASALTADFGRNGDRAIIRSNGDEWLKTADVWAATGENFWGTLLDQGADQVEQARQAAEQAETIAGQFGDLETGIALAQQAAAAAASSEAISAAKAVQTAADVVAAAASLAGAQASRDASLYGKGIFPTIAAAIGLGVVGTGPITPGATGTNGTFDLAFTGGAGSGAAGRFIVAGGVLTQVLITSPGSYTVAPTLSFAASAGLTGAAAVAVLGRNVDVGEYFWAPVSAGTLGLYSVSAGPVVTDTSVRSTRNSEEFGVVIYKSDGIELGGYYAERSASVALTLTKLFAEIVTGDVGAEVDFYLAVNGSVAYGPATVVLGTPVSLSGLSIAIGDGDQISFFILYMTENVTEFFAKAHGEIV
ncbi:MAG: hypothetical protein EOR57_06025 [Mesorhizobium sp.]|uniref:hypothetical protein n=1 Tax=Mesorhizobium sp. TaxID=1871066 RepID=UPI000FE654DC|nr:hypothetical protein [Mesorhizobium sp.]RWL21989.1 MAG: hypothetical protein EOR57_06025 [Mesorhizobium sp.]